MEGKIGWLISSGSGGAVVSGEQNYRSCSVILILESFFHYRKLLLMFEYFILNLVIVCNSTCLFCVFKTGLSIVFCNS